MATTNCRWFPVAVDKVPSYFITGGNQLNFSVMTKVADLPADVLSTADLALAANALVQDLINQGEDAEDAEAYLASGNYVTWVGQDKGTVYIFFDTLAGVFVYKQVCGAKAQLPFIIGGATLLGLGGFAYGYSRKKGGGSGVPAYALMAATVGMLVGAAGGYGIARLMTSKQEKAYEKLGLLDVRMGASRRRVTRRFCPRGMVWAPALGRCIKPL